MEKRIYNVDLENITEQGLKELQQQYVQDPMSLLKVDEVDADHLTQRFTGFLKDYLSLAGIEGYVLGLSGGLDSSLVLDLSVEAIGSENVLGLLIPSEKTSQDSIDFGKMVAKQYGVSYAVVPQELFELAILADNLIEDSIDKQLSEQGSWQRTGYSDNSMRIGNDHARQRMKILRRAAAKYGLLVGGTTNDTEQQLAYFTTAGDGRGGIDIESIVSLPKTSEFQYAKHRNLPSEVIDRIPSAELMEGHTDEGELTKLIGYDVNYMTIDLMLTGRKIGLTPVQIESANNSPLITEESVNGVFAFVDRVSFKLKPEPSANTIYFSGGDT
ncbi:NAD(+) synthase [Candidatus Woesearchaeota archaeon]|jgi:NAD+ synthase|nr:NAD(+) synthase [Candidatus Woesearchaeota archaeon]